MADSYPIRPITDDEYTAFRRVQEHAFNNGPVPAARRERGMRQFEPDRSLAAFDADLIVGTSGAYSLRMAVPGAVQPVAGVTAVSVLPTYRRRGVLRSLMLRQIADIAARGEEAVAALWASEAPIYGRYGYGRATQTAYFQFDRGDGALDPHAPADPHLTLRLVAPGECVAELAKVYDAVQLGQPGFFVRDEDWWARVLQDESLENPAAAPLRCVLAEDAAGVRGYALYVPSAGFDDATLLPHGRVMVRELLAADPAAGAALWANVLSRDLITTTTAEMRAPGDPLLFQLLDPRRARVRVADGIWVRIVDLPAALRQRGYAAPVDVVLEVTDRLLAGNAGRWRFRSGGSSSGAATCERTDAAADVSLDIRELGAVYLGGTRLGQLAAAGLVREHQPGVVARLSAALTWDPAPWCPQIF